MSPPTAATRPATAVMRAVISDGLGAAFAGRPGLDEPAEGTLVESLPHEVVGRGVGRVAPEEWGAVGAGMLVVVGEGRPVGEEDG
jgi:hypothetical protein